MEKIFNQPVDFNEGLLLIIFGKKFNQPLINLPRSLISIELGYCFNQPLIYLPENMKRIKLYNNYKYDIESLFKYEVSILNATGSTVMKNFMTPSEIERFNRSSKM